jgi:hypothetical protein
MKFLERKDKANNLEFFPFRSLNFCNLNGYSNKYKHSSNEIFEILKTINKNLKNEHSIYKAKNLINASCKIKSNSNIEFQCEKNVILKEEFEIELGSGIFIETGINLICP